MAASVLNADAGISTIFPCYTQGGLGVKNHKCTFGMSVTSEQKCRAVVFGWLSFWVLLGASSHSALPWHASYWLSLFGQAGLGTGPQTCGQTRCAAWSISCTCKRWPQWFCTSVCYRSDTAAGCAGCGFCRSHTASPGHSVCSRTSAHSFRQSSWVASALGGILQHKLAPLLGLYWCTDHQRCI